MPTGRRALRHLATLTLSTCLVALVATVASGAVVRTPSPDSSRNVLRSAPDHLAVVSTAGAAESDLGAALRRLSSPVARFGGLFAALALALLAWLAALVPSAAISTAAPGAIPRRRAPPLAA